MTSQMTYCSLFILACAAIDDLRTRKVHNWLLGLLALISLAAVIFIQGPGGLYNSLFGFLAGFIFYLPLAWFGIIGGGDLKLLAVAGICLGPTPVLIVGFFALIWGALMGVMQVLINGEAKVFISNLLRLMKFQKVETTKLHTIPYAAAIFLGALTQITWSHL